MRVAIQGEAGSFHHQAAILWFNKNDPTIIAKETFTQTIATLRDDEADQAIIAVENTLYGSINEVLDLIETNPYPIVGEIFLHIQQQLISLPDIRAKDIKRIYSHPVALAQCEQYLDKHFPDAERIEHHDTAASVRFIKEQNDPQAAAIAGIEAAKLYQLPILRQNIQDNQENYTRFLVLDPQGALPAKPNKSSLVLITDHTAGSLSYALTVFAEANVNLAKLQSRPIVGNPWRYKFYIDVETAGKKLYDLISKIEANNATVKILGEYTTGTTH